MRVVRIIRFKSFLAIFLYTSHGARFVYAHLQHMTHGYIELAIRWVRSTTLVFDVTNSLIKPDFNPEFKKTNPINSSFFFLYFFFLIKFLFISRCKSWMARDNPKHT